MGRIRTIKPEFFRHEGLFEAEQETGLPIRLAFAGLWTICDREGRFEWKPKAMKLDVMPWDDVNFTEILDALVTRGFVVRYTSGRREIGAIPSFSRHQVVNNREKASDLPPPPEAIEDIEESTRQPRVNHASTTPLVQEQGEGKGREGEGNSSEDKSSGENSPKDPLKVMFDSGIALLGQAGVKPAAARSILGKWRSEHGAELVITALGRAQREGAIDPVAFCEGAFKWKSKTAPTHDEYRDEPKDGAERIGPSGKLLKYVGWEHKWVLAENWKSGP